MRVRRRYLTSQTLPLVRRHPDGAEYRPVHIISADTADSGCEKTLCGVVVGMPGPDFNYQPGWQYAARFEYGADCQKCKASLFRLQKGA